MRDFFLQQPYPTTFSNFATETSHVTEKILLIIQRKVWTVVNRPFPQTESAAINVVQKPITCVIAKTITCVKYENISFTA